MAKYTIYQELNINKVIDLTLDKVQVYVNNRVVIDKNWKEMLKEEICTQLHIENMRIKRDNDR